MRVPRSGLDEQRIHAALRGEGAHLLLLRPPLEPLGIGRATLYRESAQYGIGLPFH